MKNETNYTDSLPRLRIDGITYSNIDPPVRTAQEFTRGLIDTSISIGNRWWWRKWEHWHHLCSNFFVFFPEYSLFSSCC